MTIQMVSQDAKYCPARDVVHMFPDVMASAAELAMKSNSVSDADLQLWLKYKRGVTEEEIAHGFICFVHFMNDARNGDQSNMTKALEASGVLSLKWEIRVAVMYYVSWLMFGEFFHGAALACDEERNITTMEALLAAGEELDRYVRMPKWRRWLYRLVRKRIPRKYPSPFYSKPSHRV
jgi:hypothetical protein